jgi:para-aminobenzoate synthetase component 1
MQQLAASEKDRAENLMIVDLLRNDLGKSCIPGSIRVDKLFDIESFPNVHHLVSTISGSLEPKLTALDLFKGCFPGGSITGAPKIRAMEIIDELEINRRGIYCGSIAYLSAHGRFDSNIAIRTLLREGSKIHCWGGGGIVADSVCSSEYQESLDKIENLMQALTGKVSGLDTYR